MGSSVWQVVRLFAKQNFNYGDPRTMARRSINLNSKIERVWQWCFPTLLVAVAPVVSQYIITVFDWGLTDHNLESIKFYASPNGELLLVATALVAESASEIWRRQISGWQKDILGTATIFFVITSTVFFSYLSSFNNSPLLASNMSCYFFAIGVSLCVVCKVTGRS